MTEPLYTHDENLIERLSISIDISKKIIMSYWYELTKNTSSLENATILLKLYFLNLSHDKIVFLKELGFGRPQQ